MGEEATIVGEEAAVGVVQNDSAASLRSFITVDTSKYSAQQKQAMNAFHGLCF